MRLLVLYYSQSGESQRAARAFATSWESCTEMTYQPIEAVVAYPHPWRSIWTFFGVMPDCLLGNCPAIQSPHGENQHEFDYVLLAYPVWFLSPALPVQSIFEQPDYVKRLKNKRVITICVCRNMWHNASERMKRLLRAAGAVHTDNIVVKHRGSFWATLVSTPRALLFGRRNRMWGVFPKAGIADQDLQRLSQLGQTAASRATAGVGASETTAALLQGQPAVHVQRRFIVPELLGWYFFFAWAVVIQGLNQIHKSCKLAGITAFIVCLLGLILIALPIAQLLTWLLLPIVGARLSRYAERLAEPTGEPVNATV